jgi:uncharacterized membrane protein
MVFIICFGIFCESDVLLLPKIVRVYHGHYYNAGKRGAGKQELALIRSCACQASAAWLTAMSTVLALELKDAEFHTAMQHRLCISQMPSNAVGLRCQCRAATSASNGGHAMTCSSIQGHPAPRYP